MWDGWCDLMAEERNMRSMSGLKVVSQERVSYGEANDGTNWELQVSHFRKREERVLLMLFH
jgi:hypothetical protein